jgi:hypothetical protein
MGLGLAACPRGGGGDGGGSLAIISPDEVGGAADGAAPAPPAGGRCPQDAPWNGRVCLGHGYVACPGGASLDDAGACLAGPGAAAQAAPVDAGAGEGDGETPRLRRGR